MIRHDTLHPNGCQTPATPAQIASLESILQGAQGTLTALLAQGSAPQHNIPPDASAATGHHGERGKKAPPGVDVEERKGVPTVWKRLRKLEEPSSLSRVPGAAWSLSHVVSTLGKLRAR